jgi:phage tail-like protein
MVMRNILLPSNLREYRFVVEVDGVPCAAFHECVGLHGYEDPIEFYIGDDEISLLDLAEPGHDMVICLSDGVTLDQSLIEWEGMTASGHPVRHDGSIVELDRFGHVKGRWRFSGAWPSRWEVARADGDSNQIATLEIVYEAIRQA